MAREDREGADEAAAPDATAGKKPVLLIALVAGALFVGGAGGWIVLAPRVLGAAAQPSGTESSDSTATPPATGRRGGAGATVLHQLDNVVVNPAGTQGTRFLITSIALEVDNAAAASELEQRDVRVRDALLRVFGARTIPELSDLSVREALRTEIAEEIGALLTVGSVRNVYFPQFVIQ